MKKTSIILSMLMFMAFTTLAMGSNPGNKTEKTKVYGNCGMCKNRIEKAVNDLSGVEKSVWDKETKMLEVTFDTEKTDIKKIQAAISAVGHDTELYSAKDEVYNELPGCCKYERKPADK